MPLTIPMPGADDATVDHSGHGHDAALVVTFRGVRVAITLRSEEHAADSDTSPDTVVVFIDEEREAPYDGGGPLSIQLNDSDLFERRLNGVRLYAGDDGILA